MTETNAGSVTYEFGDFRLDPARRRLTRADGRPVELAPKAFDALTYLVGHAGTPLTRSELSSVIWPRTIVEDNSLSKLIVALRRALGEDDRHQYVATLPGRGYQFVAEVRRTSPQELVEPSNQAAAPPAARLQRPPRRPRAALAMASLVVVAATASSVAWLAWSPTRSEPAASSTPLGIAIPRQLTAYPGYELAPALSPDGESVAFTWDGEGGNRDLYVTRIGGSGRSQLTTAREPDRFPAWSPTGAEIAFLRETGPDSFDLMIVPAAGGAERRIRTVRMRPAAVWGTPMVAWTRRGEAVVFTSRSGDGVESPHYLYRLAIASGETVQLTTGDDVYDTSPAISADGRWLAFVRHGNSTVHARGTLMVQSLTSGATAQQAIVVPLPSTGGGSTPAYVVHSPSWSDDGRYLSFVLGTDLLEWKFGAPKSRLVYAGAGLLGGLTLAGDLGALTMVRTGGLSRAVVGSVERSSDIFALPLDPTTHRAIGPPAPRFQSSAGDIHPRFSPDGRRVAFISARDGASDLWIAAADGGMQRRITSLQLPIVGFPRWSPDGRLIAFHAGTGTQRNIYFVDPDAGVPERVADGCCLEWSGDGYLYVTELGAEHTIARVRVADGARQRLFAGGFPGLTADGSTLLYGKVGEKNLYARAVAGNIRENAEELLLTDSSYPSATAATADGFFYIRYSSANEAGQIRFYDYATRQTSAVADLPAAAGELLTLTPNGSELMYAAQRASGADLWLLEFEAARE